MKKIVKTILLCLVMLTMAGCRAEKAWEGEARTAFLSQEEKECWREDLIAVLCQMHPNGHLVEADPTAEDPDLRYDYLFGGYAMALMDLNFDGTPEVIEVYAGGSSGNVTFVAYDLKTGKEILDFESGYTDAWCVYHQYDSKNVRWIGHYARRSGWESNRQCIATLTRNGNTYEEKTLFQTLHSYILEKDFHIVPSDVLYEVNGETVSAETYYYDYMDFIKNDIRIPETAVLLVEWNDVCENDDLPQVYAKKMAEALLNTEQKFIALP